MGEVAFAVLMVLLLVWAVLSRLLERLNITGALVFLVAGYVLGNPTWGPVDVSVNTPSMHILTELTLALLLFSDASRVNVATLRHDLAFPIRLLGIGLPLSIVAGSLVAAWLFGDFSWALAGFVGASLAPTDAALSAQVVNDERIPARLRRTLNVESGLNDGIATPIVAFMLAVAANELGVGHHESPEGRALFELAIGVVVGAAIGLGSAALITIGSRRNWVAHGGRRLAALGAAFASFAVAVSIDGNGFLAAFVAGMAFGASLPSDVAEIEKVDELPELVGQVFALAVWFLFGAALVPVAFDHLSVATIGYALLSLTLIRLIPVAISLLGTGMDKATVLFVGWFGPRGLASVVFALLAVEELGEAPVVTQAVAVVALTALLSVVLHGMSAGPLGARYVRNEAEHTSASSAQRP